MYAVVSTGGKQLKVSKDDVVLVEKLDADTGETITFDVLFVADGDDITVGEDATSSTRVTAEIVEHVLGDKAVVFKFKKRKGYKRLKGHRQQLTRVRITDIETGVAPSKVSKVAKEKVAAPEKSPEKKETAPKVEAVVEAVEVAAGQCEAVKADGERCQNPAKEGSKYCGVHAKKYENQ